MGYLGYALCSPYVFLLMIYSVMGLKIYKIRCVGNESTFPIEVNGDRMYVTFKRRFGERLGSLSCDDVTVQRAR